MGGSVTTFQTYTKTIKAALRPDKIIGRSGDAINQGEKCSFHVYASLLLRHYQILTVSNTYYVLTTRPSLAHQI